MNGGDIVGLIVFAFISLGLGIIVERFLHRHSKSISIPYDLIIFFIGLVIGTILFHINDGALPLHLMISSSSCQLIGDVLLPIILFQQVFFINRFDIFQVLVPSILLGGKWYIYSYGTHFILIIHRDRRWHRFDVPYFSNMHSIRTRWMEL